MLGAETTVTVQFLDKFIKVPDVAHRQAPMLQTAR